MTQRWLLPCLLIAVSLGCTCDKKTPSDSLTQPTPDLPRDLKPLPAAPAIAVPQEALPGSGSDLAVVASRPQGEVRGEVRPTVTFSRPIRSLEMVEAQRARDAEKPFAKIEPALAGEWRWLGSASAEFVPSGLAPLSTQYTVTVLKGLKALDGAELAQEHVFTFETPRLEAQDAAPFNRSRWLATDSTIRLLFNQPVKKESLAALKLEVEGQPPIALNLKESVSIEEERRAEIEKAKKEGRSTSYDRLSDEKRGAKNQQMRYVLAPLKPLPLNAALTLKLDTLVADQGPLTPKRLDTLTWRTYAPMELTEARFCRGQHRCPHGPLFIFTTNQAELETLKTRIKITPAVEIDWANARTWVPSSTYELNDSPPYVMLPGKWKPGTQYALEVAPGVADVFKQTAAHSFSAKVHTDDLAPALMVGNFMGLIEATAEAPKLPVEVSNLTTLEVRMWSLTIPEIVRATATPHYDSAPLLTRAADFSETEALKYPRNLARVHPIALTKLFKEKKTGVALVTMNSPQLEYQPPNGFRELVQVTDLAAHLKLGPKKSLVWVTRLSNGEGVEGAEIQVYDQSAAMVWSGKTGSSGLCDMPGTIEMKLKNPQYAWETPFAVVTAQKDGDLSFTANTWASGVEPYEFGLSSGWEGEKPASNSFIFSDRGIYRPGDKAYFKGVVRYRQVGELRAGAEGSKLSVQLTDSRGEKVKAGTVKLTAYGTFSFEADLPKEGALGYYLLTATGKLPLGELSFLTGFRVEEYRAPQFRVDVETAKKSYLSGDELEANVFARYLFGGAMADAKVKWSVNRNSTLFTAQSAPDFSFAQETWWWDDRAPENSSGFFASDLGRVDAKGALKAKAGRVEAPGEKPYLYTFEAEVEDVNRQTVAGRADVTVHPAAYYVGLRARSYFMEVGKEYPLDTMVVDTEGKRTAGKKVDVKVVLRTWKSVKQKDATGGFTTVSEPDEKEVHSCSLTSSDSAVPCNFKPSQAGFFIVKASVKDDAGRKHSASLGVYATGAGWVAWQRSDTDRIELVVDKAQYAVGDTAKVLIKSPYPAAKGLLTVEREGVLDRRALDLKGSVNTVEIPITEDAVPNLYVGVILMHRRVAQGGVESGDDPGRPSARIGLVKLKVEEKTKRLQVAVKTDKADYRPRDEVQVEVAVKDAAGKAEDAEVTLYVVDEAVLRLTDYKTPDPLTYIFRERPLSVRLGEPLLHLVRRRNYGEKGESQGGGGGESSDGVSIRTNFKTTVLFNPTLETKNGVAQARFKLPDNLTTFRVMAVAITRKERFGSGEASLKVNKPVLALPALPRFARVGDKFEAGVVVHSYGAGAGEVTVKAEVSGAVLNGAAEQKVQVAEGAPKEVRFSFTAEKPGLATFRFKALKGADNDGVEQKIPIELPVAIETVATYGDTKDVRVEGLKPPSSVYDDLGGLEVSLASTSLGNFQQGFQQLIEYPYGCLEQQSSRLVPFIALREISGQFGVPWPGPSTGSGQGPNAAKQAKENELNAWLRTYLFDTLDVSHEKDPDRVIAATVKSILNLQEPDGAFRYWSDSYCASSWQSTYATMALTRAQEVGFEVPAERLARAQAFVTRVASGQCHPCELSCPDETRVFASYVLARSKKPLPSTYDELYGRREQLPLFSRALLANAMFVGGGDRSKAKTLLQEILNFGKESPKGVHFEEASSKTYLTLWHSDTRTTGVVLQALTDIAPDHPYVSKIAHYLTSVRQGNGQWRSTQEAAFSLLGLTEVLRTKEKDTPDFKAAVAFGDAELYAHDFKGRSMSVEQKKIPLVELLNKSEQKLTFKKEGVGVLYYSATLRYAPKQMPTASLDNGLFVQRWFEPYEGGGQSTKFYAGDLVRVRVRVGSSQERHWAAIEVPLPAGLEAIDTTLATSAKLKTTPHDQGPGEEYDAEGDEDVDEGSAMGGEDVSRWAYSFYSPFNHTEMRDSKVMVFADHLPPGVHVSSFVARATTPGVFVLKPARGELMYEPEVWGRSEGGAFEIVVPPQVSQK